jgi:catechol 2,3-dioxygenase-like lactoylglutathione lyase family enzyme
MVREEPMSVSIQGMVPLLQVFDMPRAVAFYRDIFGFAVASTSAPRGRDDFDWCLLRRDGVELMLNTAYEADHRPGTPEPARVATHKDTGLFFACPDVDGAHVHLRAQGIDIEPPTIAPYGMKQLYLRDPHGYEICLQSRASEPDGHA